jgi:DNA-binding response OmpR family regulator
VRVLIVDDDRHFAAALTALLEADAMSVRRSRRERR